MTTTFALLIFSTTPAASSELPADARALVARIDEATSFIDSLEFQFEGDVIRELLEPGTVTSQFLFNGDCRYKRGAGFRFSTTDEYPDGLGQYEQGSWGGGIREKFEKLASSKFGTGLITIVSSKMALLWTGRNTPTSHFAVVDLPSLIGGTDILTSVGGDGKSLRFVTHKLETPYTVEIKFDPAKGWATSELTRTVFGKPWMCVKNIKHRSFPVGDRVLWLPVQFEIHNYMWTIDPAHPEKGRKGGTPLTKKKMRHPGMIFDAPVTRQRFRLLTDTVKFNHLKSDADIRVQFPSGVPIHDTRRKDGKKVIVAGQTSFTAKDRKELAQALETTVDAANAQLEPLRLSSDAASSSNWWLAGIGTVLVAVGVILIFRHRMGEPWRVS